MTLVHLLGAVVFALAAVSAVYVAGSKSRDGDIERLEGELDKATGESLRFQKAYAAKADHVSELALELRRMDEKIRGLQAKVPARGPGGRFAAK